MVETLLYDAFISYNHKLDKSLVKRLQKQMQSLGKAWWQRRAVRVFRDEASQGATPELWPDIERALSQSNYLILCASPEAAVSHWVDKEVRWWLEHKSCKTILIALTAGDLQWDNAAGDFVWDDACPLPRALLNAFSGEPKWVDFRPYRVLADGARADDGFLGLVADLSSTIRGIPKEDLLSEEVRQQKRNQRIALATAGTLALLASSAIVAALFARNQQLAAEFNYLRQREITASQSLRQGDFASAALALPEVVASGDTRLTGHGRYHTLLARFEPLTQVLNRFPPWSVLTWQTHTYVRGERDDELYSIGQMTEPHWIRNKNLLIVLDEIGNISVFDYQLKKIVDQRTANDRFKLCDLKVENDGSTQIYGIGSAGVTLGGVFYTRWSVTSDGKAAYETDHMNFGTWKNLSICPDMKASDYFRKSEKLADSIVFPKMLSENSLWRTEDRAPNKDGFFDSYSPDKIWGFIEKSTGGDAKIGNFETTGAAIESLFCDGNYCDVFVAARQIGAQQVLFGLRLFGMAGESYSFCVRAADLSRIGCTQFDILYNNQALNGIRLSRNGERAVAFGHSFGVNRPWREAGGQTTSLAISNAPRFEDWVTPSVFQTEIEIQDARFDPSGRYLAVLSQRGVHIYDLQRDFALVNQISAAGTVQIAWLGSASLALLSSSGVLRARSLLGSELWSDVDLKRLPFETVKSSDGEKANKTWWIDVNDTGDISLVGNGQSAVMIDAKIGAAITGELELFVTPHKFDHPIIHTTEDGGLSVEARGKVFRRRGLGPVKNEAYLVGRTGLLSLSELTDGFK